MFEGVAGQARVKRVLERALREDRLSHAYLFAGQEGLGKLELARELGVALVAPCGGCGACDECERARRGLHPDLAVIEAEGDEIRIGQIQTVVADLALRPFTATRRVWVIPECERLNDPAANKLLKSLEEPPAHVHFLLVSDRVERVKPTIVSRCQVIDLAPISEAEVAEHLVRVHGVPGDEAATLARLARGSVDRAARLAADARGPRRREQYLVQAARLVGGPAGGPAGGEGQTRRPGPAFIALLEAETAAVGEEVAVRAAAEIAATEQAFSDKRERERRVKAVEARAKREQLRRRRLAALDALDLLASWLRDLLALSCGAPATILNVDRRASLEESALAAPEVYRRLLGIIAATRGDLYLNIDQKLALQAMMVRFEEVTGA
ncbi:MAG: DNA polymerase III subunit [Actinomycetota bacterium]|nr:MAG: DNA polymerase III subunit [Actinomycetota bacterium]